MEINPPGGETSECGIVYYSRYYKLRAGERFPDGPWLLSPRGDLGYAAYASFFGDNSTFAAVLSVPTRDHELRILQHEAAFTAVCGAIPQLAQFLAVTEPISDVMAMGGLQNVLRHYVADKKPTMLGLLPVADAICHTDPSFALGLSFSLVHAVAAAQAIASDIATATATYFNHITNEAQERFRLARDTDDARNRRWAGEPLEFTRAEGCLPLFALLAAGIAATHDADVFRSYVRRIGFLDRTSVFDSDEALHRRVEAIVASQPPTKTAELSRGEMLILASSALTASRTA
jgi:hypothetical protein